MMRCSGELPHHVQVCRTVVGACGPRAAVMLSQPHARHVVWPHRGRSHVTPYPMCTVTHAIAVRDAVQASARRPALPAHRPIRRSCRALLRVGWACFVECMRAPCLAWPQVWRPARRCGC